MNGERQIINESLRWHIQFSALAIIRPVSGMHLVFVKQYLYDRECSQETLRTRINNTFCEYIRLLQTR